MKKIIWNDADIDAAYLMGVVNAACHFDVNDDETMPSLVIIGKEIARLQSLGYKRPYEAIVELRKKKLEDDSLINFSCKACGKELKLRGNPERFCMDPSCDEYCKLQ